MQTDLTKDQLGPDGKPQYAIYLPALSTFYATYIGKQRFGEHVKKSRIPSNLYNGVEGLNFLNTQKGMFKYQWALYSAGHAELDVNKHAIKEDMVRNRDRENSWLLGDSGGFQIAKGVWPANWADPTCKHAMKKRKQVLEWMEAYMDYGMVLDVPSWIRDPVRGARGQKNTDIRTFQDSVDATHINNQYWMQNRTGNCKFLNVLQGENHAECEDWYHEMRDYCDPKIYPETHFNGWSMGGQNSTDVHITLHRLIDMIYDGLLEENIHDYVHFLGTSKLEWALLLTDIQRSIRKYHNPNFTATYDCASPFLATANGQIYIDIVTPDHGKWSYKMRPTVDDKKYANDMRLYRDVVLNDGHLEVFMDSPITKDLKISDVCIYDVNSLNAMGKTPKTSWDSFSYELQMAHNIWLHIRAVQQANQEYDTGKIPYMLEATKLHKKRFAEHRLHYFRDIIDEIFSSNDKQKAIDTIEEFSRYWMDIPGTGGASGKKTINSSTKFYQFFDFVSDAVATVDDDKDDDEMSIEEIDHAESIIDQLEN